MPNDSEFGTSQRPSFRELRRKLALPVLLGSVVLMFYLWELLALNIQQVQKMVLYAAMIGPLSLLWPIPINRKLISPVIEYLKGNGSPDLAEKVARSFPLRSALLSMFSWTLAGIANVGFMIHGLHVPSTYGLYTFMATVTAGFAASFVHFYILRRAMESVRIRIAEETEKTPQQLRYRILMKLLIAFSSLVALSLVSFALRESSSKQQALRLQSVKMLETQVSHWKTILNKDPSNESLLPSGFTIEKELRPEDKGVRVSIEISGGRYLVARAQEPVETLDMKTVAIILLTIFLVGLISYFAASEISDHQNQIREATNKIAEGDFDFRLTVVTDDEVAELARSINLMAAQLKDKMNRLEEANLELKKLDALKSNFLSNISHELKTPLVASRGYVDFILRACAKITW